jgi:hypothetical protein
MQATGSSGTGNQLTIALLPLRERTPPESQKSERHMRMGAVGAGLSLLHHSCTAVAHLECSMAHNDACLNKGARRSVAEELHALYPRDMYWRGSDWGNRAKHDDLRVCKATLGPEAQHGAACHLTSVRSVRMHMSRRRTSVL